MLTVMQRARTYIVGVVIWASVFLFGVLAAFADSYTVNVVAYTQSENFAGIDTAGDFVVNLTNSLVNPGHKCGGVAGASTCFETFYVGQQNPVFSTALPGLDWDNGARCTVGALSGVCNNGHQVLGGFLDGVEGVWTGTGSLTEILPGGSFDGGYVNALGDAVFIDGANDTLVSVVDTPNTGGLGLRPLIIAPQAVPEPASVWLVGLGMMVAARFVLRRRATYRVVAKRRKR